MGCGISTMDAEHANRNRHSSGPLRRHKMAVTAKKLPKEQDRVHSRAKQSRKSLSRQGNNVILVMKPILGHHEVSGKQDCLDCKKIGEKEMEKQKRVNEEGEEENNGRDDIIDRGRGSLSFRDYCIDHESDASSCKPCLTVDPSFRDLICNGFDALDGSKNGG